MIYAGLYKQFENAENLAGKAWQHAVNPSSNTTL